MSLPDILAAIRAQVSAVSATDHFYAVAILKLKGTSTMATTQIKLTVAIVESPGTSPGNSRYSITDPAGAVTSQDVADTVQGADAVIFTNAAGFMPGAWTASGTQLDAANNPIGTPVTATFTVPTPATGHAPSALSVALG
jgi:hypothetical protein